MKTIDFSYFIERYNAGEMNEAEKLWFQKELEGNPKLRQEVTLRKKTDQALMNHGALELRNKLIEIEKRRAAAIPVKSHKKNSTSTLRYAAVITGLILIGSFLLFKGKSLTNNEIIDQYYKPYEVVSGSRSLQVVTNSDYSRALEYYNIHDYRNAALYFSKVLNEDPKYIESAMFNGVSNYEAKNYPVAKQEFMKVLDNNNNLFMEDARWYLALCYIQTSDKGKATEQLMTIKNSSSIYSKDARKILKRMK
jgi:tetratricopeptide (TPR) repeat protein